VEAVTLRALARAPGPPLERLPLATAEGPPPTSPTRVRYLTEDLVAERVARGALRAGHRLHGPLVVEEYSATTWVPPRWALEVDAHGVLHLLPPG
jgi:N-methylhydantoinase A